MNFFLLLLSFLIASFSGFTEEKKTAQTIKLEIQRGEELAHKKIPLFYLSAIGLQKGDFFKIAHRNGIGNMMILLEGIYEGNGRIKKEKSVTLNLKDLSMNTFEPIAIGGFHRGEESEFIIMDSKDNILNRVIYLPEPLEVTASDKAKFSMYYLGETLYGFEGTNFIPGEVIEFISVSGTETVKNSYTIDSSGSLRGTLIANENTHPSKMNVTIKRKKETLSLDYGSNPSVYSASRSDNPMVLFTIDHLPAKEELEMANKFHQILLQHFNKMAKKVNYLKKPD